MSRSATSPAGRCCGALSLRIDNDDRIALLGANGNGKSTLVKLLAGRLAPSEGSITRADKLEVAYFAQHQLDELDPAESAYDHVRALMPRRARGQGARARRRHRLFRRGADTPVASLSGGEKARLLLGLATFDGPHLVILDEPTNHLDIDSRAALIEAINDFPGAVILVSHDRYLLEACADRLWLVADGAVTPFDGDLDDYRGARARRGRATGPSATASRPSASRAPISAAPPRRSARSSSRSSAASTRRKTEIGKWASAIATSTQRSPAICTRAIPPGRTLEVARRRGRSARGCRGRVAGAQRRV